MRLFGSTGIELYVAPFFFCFIVKPTFFWSQNKTGQSPPLSFASLRNPFFLHVHRPLHQRFQVRTQWTHNLHTNSLKREQGGRAAIFSFKRLSIEETRFLHPFFFDYLQ